MPQSNPVGQCASAVLMMAPHDFEFNPETSQDNEFMHSPREDGEAIRQRALDEFVAMVEQLREHGIKVVIPPPRVHGPRTPDAVFPNNWFSTEHDGTVVLYPMAPESRRTEKRIEALENALVEQNFAIKRIINIGHWNETERFLEGTGSLCIDHVRRRVFAAKSERCHPEQVANFVETRGYTQATVFNTQSRTGHPIYHTNVMLSIGEKFAVVCAESIVDAQQRQEVLDALGPDREIITFSRKQVEDFCGNIQQLRARNGKTIIVMSQRAHDGFTAEQRQALSRHGTLVPIPLTTIEHIGGGSARCMIAEIFLPTLR